MPRRSRLLVAAAATAGLLAAPLAVQAAPGDVIVNAKDDKFDVKLYSDDGGLTTKQRKSIDIRKLTLEERPGGAVRFTVRLWYIDTSNDFDQVIDVQLKPTDPDDVWSASVGMSPQDRDLAYAYYSPTLDGDDTKSCDPLTAKVSKAKRTVSVDVPKRCLPTDPAKIRLGAYAAFFRSEGVGYSRDKLKVPGSYVIRPGVPG